MQYIVELLAGNQKDSEKKAFKETCRRRSMRENFLSSSVKKNKLRDLNNNGSN